MNSIELYISKNDINPCQEAGNSSEHQSEITRPIPKENSDRLLKDEFYFPEDTLLDLDSFIKYRGVRTEENRRRIGLFESLIVPVRTNSIKNFCSDFFFPALLYVRSCFENRVLEINNLVARIFLALASIVLDICTLPLRMITVIPRAIYNYCYSKEKHNLYKFLIKNGVSSDDLERDSVYVQVMSKNNREIEMSQGTFNFIHLPLYAEEMHEWTSNRWLIGDGGLFNEQEPLVMDPDEFWNSLENVPAPVEN